MSGLTWVLGIQTRVLNNWETSALPTEQHCFFTYECTGVRPVCWSEPIATTDCNHCLNLGYISTRLLFSLSSVQLSVLPRPSLISQAATDHRADLSSSLSSLLPLLSPKALPALSVDSLGATGATGWCSPLPASTRGGKRKMTAILLT